MKQEEKENLLALIEERGENKKSLAEYFGRDPRMSTSLFSGTRDLNLGELDKVAELLGMDVFDVLARIKGRPTSEPWDDEIFALATSRARIAIDRAKVKLSGPEYSEFVYFLYKHGLSEKKAEGSAHLTQATVDFLLKQKCMAAN